MSHEKIVCPKCEKVIKQCRCIEGHKNTIYRLCDSCKDNCELSVDSKLVDVAKDKIIADLEQKLSETELRLKNSEWIKCSDRLPEETNKYYLTFEGDYMDCAFLNVEYKWYVEGNKIKGITHWMPLPKKPNE